MKKKVVVVLFLIVIAALACGCGGKKFEFPEPSVEKADGAFVSKASTFTIGSDEYAADVGTITVSENRNRASSRRIHLPVIRIHSNSKSPREPIFCFSGGPGGSNMHWLESMWHLLPEHDIVAVGYRGVDGSTVLDCPEVAQAFKSEEDLLSDASMKTIGRAWSASARRLTAQGIDLDGYTVLEVIEDNESVRKAFGYERMSLYSGSYGTRVAYLYGLIHPEVIQRSAMIAVNPPGRFVWEPRTIDSQLKHYSALWSKDSIMSLRSPDLYATMRTVLANMPRTWLMLPINSGKVKVITFALLFQRSTAAKVFDAYVAAQQGDPSGLALMSSAYDYFVPSMSTWGEMASKAVSADFDSTRNYCLDMEPSGMPLGSPMSKLLWGPLSYGRWPVQQLPEEFRKTRQSDVRTLLLSGSTDFSTPPEFATTELLPYLTNGTQVVLSECGHVDDILYLRPENARRILTGFYDTGVPDMSMNMYVPMDFQVRWGFPALAKAVFGAVSFLAIVLIVVIVWLVRKVWVVR